VIHRSPPSGCESRDGAGGLDPTADKNSARAGIRRAITTMPKNKPLLNLLAGVLVQIRT
jgi:hypothetical protein